MMQGIKRTVRPPILMKRNTSMTEFTLDFYIGTTDQYQSSLDPFNGDQRFTGSAVRPLHRRNSSEFVETSHFLKVCSLCNTRLIPGRDIYMYRGDSAFCSLECRQQQLTQDERKEKCSSASKREPSSTTATTVKVSAAAGGSVAAS